ncbi:MAG: DUF5686 family protein [Leadbetterella sp.]
MPSKVNYVWKLIFFLLFLLLTISQKSIGQDFFLVRGKISDSTGQTIPNVNIRLFQENIGTQSNSQGEFKLKLLKGYNKLIFTSVGYKPHFEEIVVEKDQDLNLILTPDITVLNEVAIRLKQKDPAYQIMKDAIDARENNQRSFQNMHFKTYTKSIGYLKKNNKDTLVSWYEGIATVTKGIDKNQIKETKEGVKKWGDMQDLFYTSYTDGDFNFYKGNIFCSRISPSTYIGPLSKMALLGYKFKLLSSYYVNTQKVYRIKMTPRDASNAFFEGVVEILDESFQIKNLQLKFSSKGLIVFNYFEIKQTYRQSLGRSVADTTYFTWKRKDKKHGNTLFISSEFEFDKPLSKGFFGNELGSVEQEAFKRDSSYWQEKRGYVLDSLENIALLKRSTYEKRINSKQYLDSIDKFTNKITFSRLTIRGIERINRINQSTWFFAPAIAVYNPFGIGGARIGYGIGYYKRFKDKKALWFNSYPSYGHLNNDFRGTLTSSYLYNPFKQSRIGIELNKDIRLINENERLVDILKRTNLYYYFGVDLKHETEYFNGLKSNISLSLKNRSDLTRIKPAKFEDQIFVNNPLLTFPTTNLVALGISMDYTPGQLYLREPYQKLILGSKYPTFRIGIKQTFDPNNSMKKAFRTFNMEIFQNKNLGIAGTLNYTVKSGVFLDTASLSVMDYKYLRGGDSYFLFSPLTNYQYLPTTIPIKKWHLQSHFTHQFNGLLISKIPLLNKTGIKEMIGGGYLWAPEYKLNYTEFLTGITKVVKIGRFYVRSGVYYVISNSNVNGFRDGFKVSFDFFNPFKNTYNF